MVLRNSLMDFASLSFSFLIFFCMSPLFDDMITDKPTVLDEFQSSSRINGFVMLILEK